MRSLPLPARRRARVLEVGLAAAAVLAQMGCAPDPASSPDDVGAVRVAITTVPADVSCVSLTAAGASRTVTRLFDVSPGASSVLVLAGVPTGSVMFSGQAFAGACAMVQAGSVAGWSSDVVTVQVASGATADVTLTMRRNGNANVHVDFQDDTSVAVPTTTTLTAPVNPAVVGQVAPLVVKVTSASGQVPTGSVRLSEDGTPANVAALDANGAASFGFSSIFPTTHVFTVDYLPTGGFQISSSAPVTLVVTQAATRTALPASGDFVTSNGQLFLLVGSTITLTSSVTVQAPGRGTPTGSVFLNDGSSDFRTVDLAGGGASFQLTFSLAGPVTLTARYGGDQSFTGSTSPPLSFQVVDQLP
jgi:Bacterial Ig-like domain (group 3)